MKTIWILADQLSPENAALAGADPAERRADLGVQGARRGLRYHQQKLVLVYSGMRHFARDLEAAGWRVDYHRLDETPDFLTGLQRHVERFQPDEIRARRTQRVAMTAALPKFARRLGVPIRAVPTASSSLAREDFAAWAGESAHLVMEEHYRRMRRRTGWLMESPWQARAKPVGGAWNFDPLNRQTYKQYAASGRTQPAIPCARRPTRSRARSSRWWSASSPIIPAVRGDFWFPVDRAGALRWLEKFVTERLEHFGPFEDVIAQDQPVIYHSVLSPLLNLGLLHAAASAWSARWRPIEAGRAPIQSVEGYVRQIIGWREFINGAYWHAMPDYKEVNYLQARPARAGLVLHGRDGDELPAPGDQAGAGSRLDAPHPAADGRGQFLPDRGHRPAGGVASGIWR